MRHLPILFLAALPTFACGVCGCSTHTDWATQGLWSGQGFRLSLQHDYADQNQLRTGTKAVDRAAFPLPAEQELQLQTINRTLTLGLDWSPSDAWGLNLALPFAHRTHETLAEGDVEASASRHAGLGDVRLLGRYQGFLQDRSFGVQIGVKLATGKKDEAFAGGPQTGEPVDCGLQLGTGTTDLLLGLYKFGELNASWSYFSQAILQVATHRSEGFRPGNAFTFSSGLRHTGPGAVQPQLQLSLRTERPESGANADEANSGGTFAYASPGLVAQVTERTSLSAFVQVPIFQRVNGLQLQPKALFSVALHAAF